MTWYIFWLFNGVRRTSYAGMCNWFTLACVCDNYCVQLICIQLSMEFRKSNYISKIELHVCSCWFIHNNHMKRNTHFTIIKKVLAYTDSNYGSTIADDEKVHRSLPVCMSIVTNSFGLPVQGLLPLPREVLAPLYLDPSTLNGGGNQGSAPKSMEDHWQVIEALYPVIPLRLADNCEVLLSWV